MGGSALAFLLLRRLVVFFLLLFGLSLPELVAGPDWAEHCEEFFRRFDAIEGARLPGSRRHKNRTSAAPREIDAGLVERITALCG